MTRAARIFRHSQRGVTLIVALVMLVLMTLLALAAINLSTGNLKIVGNMQYQQEATSAAQSAINQVLSKGSYLSNPTTAPTSITVNVNGGAYTVAMTPPCLLSSIAIKVSELSLTNREDVKCISSGSPVNEQSDCARVTWQVKATVNDAGTKAKVELVEGATMRMDRILADAYKSDSTKRCP
jgi:Tfp pilus assembly protein PilX